VSKIKNLLNNTTILRKSYKKIKNELSVASLSKI